MSTMIPLDVVSFAGGVHVEGPSEENHRLGILQVLANACITRGRCSGIYLRIDWINQP